MAQSLSPALFSKPWLLISLSWLWHTLPPLAWLSFSALRLQPATPLPLPPPGGTLWAGPWWLVGAWPVMYQEHRGRENACYPHPLHQTSVSALMNVTMMCKQSLIAYNYQVQAGIVVENFHLPTGSQNFLMIFSKVWVHRATFLLVLWWSLVCLRLLRWAFGLDELFFLSICPPHVFFCRVAYELHSGLCIPRTQIQKLLGLLKTWVWHSNGIPYVMFYWLKQITSQDQNSYEKNLQMGMNIRMYSSLRTTKVKICGRSTEWQ